jgi:hypothetical protein
VLDDVRLPLNTFRIKQAEFVEIAASVTLQDVQGFGGGAVNSTDSKTCGGLKALKNEGGNGGCPNWLLLFASKNAAICCC